MTGVQTCALPICQQIAASQEQTKIAMAQAKMAETRVREKEVAIDAANHAADRRSKEALAQADLEQSMLVHSDKLMKDRASMQADDQYRQQEAEFKRQQAMQKLTGIE